MYAFCREIWLYIQTWINLKYKFVVDIVTSTRICKLKYFIDTCLKIFLTTFSYYEFGGIGTKSWRIIFISSVSIVKSVCFNEMLVAKMSELAKCVVHGIMDQRDQGGYHRNYQKWMGSMNVQTTERTYQITMFLIRTSTKWDCRSDLNNINNTTLVIWFFF